MVDPQNVTFPLTVESFFALQRAELGREICKTEKELFALIVDMANDAYEAATRGDAEAVLDLLNSINHITVQDDYTRHLSVLCRSWVLLGCRRGTELLAKTGLSPN